MNYSTMLARSKTPCYIVFTAEALVAILHGAINLDSRRDEIFQFSIRLIGRRELIGNAAIDNPV